MALNEIYLPIKKKIILQLQCSAVVHYQLHLLQFALTVCLSILPLQIADFWKEALILSSLHHPNVVSFYGIVRDGPGGSLATVTEFMVNGSLKQFLQKKDR